MSAPHNTQYSTVAPIAPGAMSGGPVLPPGYMRATDFINSAPPPPPDLVEGIISSGGRHLFVGAPGCKKTHGALEIARAVARGDRAFGRFQAQQGAVVLLEQEHSSHAWAERMRQHDLYLYTVVTHHHQEFNLLNKGQIAELILVLNLIDARLLVLDPFADLHSCDEDKATDMKPVIAALGQIGMARPHTSILVLHHSAKSDWIFGKAPTLAGVRGSSRITGSFDSVHAFKSKGTSGDVDIHCLKNKDASPLPPHRLTLCLPPGGRATWTASPIATKKSKSKTAPIEVARNKILSAIASGQTFQSANDASKILGGNRKVTLEAWQELINIGELAYNGSTYGAPVQASTQTDQGGQT